MRITSIASGSSGNSIYVGSDTTHLLVDVGISGKKVLNGVNALDLDMQDIDGIFITHEHSDHIAGLGVVARRYGIPIYLTRGTKEAILRSGTVGKIDESLFTEVRPDEKLTIKDITINPMRVSHDAADPVAYRFKSGDKNIGIITDLGTYNDYTVESLRGMDALFIEANHDVNMLEVGPYPYPLKQRILGDKGHLSNELAGGLLTRLMNDRLQAVFLGHLSKENNLPELAYESVRVEVTMNQSRMDNYNGIKISDFPMFVAKRDEISDIVSIA